MPDDDLLAQLGAFAREQEQARDPLLDKLVEGKASREEVAALEQRAAGNPEAEAELERHRPLGDTVRERIVARAHAELTRGQPAKVLPMRRRWAVPAAALVAAAAAVLLMLRSPSAETLPAYSLTASGGVDEVRGSHEAKRIVLAPGSRLELILRPASDLQGEVRLKALLRGPGGVEPVALTPEVSAQGAMRVRASADVFGVRRGEHELLLVTCRPDTCAGALEAARRGEREGPGYQVLVQPLAFP